MTDSTVIDYNPRVLLVTGGAGFIGSHFVRYLLASYPDVTVVNLDALTYAGSMENLRHLSDIGRHHFIEGDINNRTLVDQVLRHYAVDTIVHFAAESHVDRSIAAPSSFIETNIVGTFTLLEAARQYWLQEQQWSPAVCRFHHISTDEVYGTLTDSDPAFSETTPYAPNSPYSASKASSDHLVRAYHETYRLPVTISNCSNNYGPYQHTEKFMPTVVRSCVQQQPIPVYGNGKNKRDWLFVTDHCQAIDRVIRRGRLGEKYHIGGEAEYENITIATMICDIMDGIAPQAEPHRTLIRYVTDRAGHDWRYAMDIRKIASELSWRPTTSLQQGLTQTVQWYVNDYRP